MWKSFCCCHSDYSLEVDEKVENIEKVNDNIFFKNLLLYVCLRETQIEEYCVSVSSEERVRSSGVGVPYSCESLDMSPVENKLGSSGRSEIALNYWIISLPSLNSIFPHGGTILHNTSMSCEYEWKQIMNCSCRICRLVINNWKPISVKYVEHVSFLSLFSDTNDFCWITPLGNLWGNQGPKFAQKLGSFSGFLTVHWTLRYLSQKPGSYASFLPTSRPSIFPYTSAGSRFFALFYIPTSIHHLFSKNVPS